MISPLAKGNAYDSTLTYTHSSHLQTMQELFGVYGFGRLVSGHAGIPGTKDLADLFLANAIVPEPSSLVLCRHCGSTFLAGWHWGRRRRAHYFRAK